MASSRFSSNQPDLTDVAVTLAAFEKINQVRVQISLNCVEEKGRTDVCITSTAWQMASPFTEAGFLASSSATCLAMNLRSLEAALIHSLYSLDGQLAKREFEKVATK